jgi:FKBP-type peptidyl-prolyl cis-trans isomerase
MKKLLLLLIVPVLGLLSSCKSDFPGYDKTETGLYYKFHIENKKAKIPQIGDIITVDMTYRTKDTIIFNSAELKEEFRFPLDEPTFRGDIFEGLAMMHLGDSASFIVSADSLKKFGNLPPLDSGLVLYFDVKLKHIQPKAEFEKQKQEFEKQQAEALEKLKSGENDEILKYVTDNKIKVKPLESGLYFISQISGSGQKVEKGKIIAIHYSATFLNGDKLFNSKEKQKEPVYIEIGKDIEIQGLEEGVLKMKAGGKARLLIPSALAYGEKGIKGLIGPYSPLIYDVEVLSIIPKEKYSKMMQDKEKTAIEKYLKDNNVNVGPTSNGLFYIELKKGNGKKPVAGKKVIMHYTGMFLDGKIFDSSVKTGMPIEFVYGKGEYIEGLEEGLSYMNAGGKARLIIPSNLAFGNEYSGNIAPFTPLLFEVELINVK